MLSATVNDKSGRTLTGQSLEALFTSLSHYPILSFGLNCSFGAKELHHFLRELAPRIPCYISIYPNAGLPNEMGEYDESPEFTAFVYKTWQKRD
ncbi:MAG: homocysteine S-methyltransferase family protein [Butyricimonas faecalis]